MIDGRRDRGRGPSGALLRALGAILVAPLLAIAGCNDDAIDMAKVGGGGMGAAQERVQEARSVWLQGALDVCPTGSLALVFEEGDDIFAFPVYAPAAAKLTVQLKGSALLDTVLFVYGPQSETSGLPEDPIHQDDDSGDGGLSGFADAPLPQAGTYWVVLTSWYESTVGSLEVILSIDNALPCDSPETATSPDCLPECDDGIDCTDDTCQPTGGCDFVPVDSDCEDGNPCTIDACNPNSGCISQTLDCEDGNPCTIDQCDAGTGQCESVPDDTLCSGADPMGCASLICDADAGCISFDDDAMCDDDEDCTLDACVGGVCQSAPLDNACDDGDACTEDLCTSPGGCQHLPVSCEDSDPCTLDACDVEQGCVYLPDPTMAEVPSCAATDGEVCCFADTTYTAMSEGECVGLGGWSLHSDSPACNGGFCCFPGTQSGCYDQTCSWIQVCSLDLYLDCCDWSWDFSCSAYASTVCDSCLHAGKPGELPVCCDLDGALFEVSQPSACSGTSGTIVPYELCALAGQGDGELVCCDSPPNGPRPEFLQSCVESAGDFLPPENCPGLETNICCQLTTLPPGEGLLVPQDLCAANEGTVLPSEQCDSGTEP